MAAVAEPSGTDDLAVAVNGGCLGVGSAGRYPEIKHFAVGIKERVAEVFGCLLRDDYRAVGGSHHLSDVVDGVCHSLNAAGESTQIDHPSAGVQEHMKAPIVDPTLSHYHSGAIYS